jgi:hypothetical protein
MPYNIIYLLIVLLFIVLTYIILKNYSLLEFSSSNSNIYEKFSVYKYNDDIDTGLYTAVIVEPRKHKALEFVLNNFMTNLNEDWNFVIFHGIDNKEYVKNIIDTKLQNHKHRITLVNIGLHNLTVAQYSMIFYDEEFYKYIPTETFLVFQTDSVILKENKEKINDFLKYDYVGAPWPKTMGILGNMEVGNGGLSLRKKSKMLELLKYKDDVAIENGIYGKYIAEDQFFNGYHVKNIHVYKPIFIKAKEFSIEAVFHKSPFGVHKPWLGVRKEELFYLTNVYPEIGTLIKLNQ